MTKLRFILLLSVALRVLAALYMGDEVVSLPGTADQVSYHNLALRVLAGHGFTFGETWWPVTAAGAPTAHWSYLYTLYLVSVYAIFGPNPLFARLIQAVIVGLLQPFLAYRLGDQIRSAYQVPGVVQPRWENLPLLAAGITAIYVYFVYYAGTLMTEPFYLTAVIAGLTLTIALARRLPEQGYWKLALGLGLTLSMAVLLRQLFLLVIPFIFLWLGISTYRRHAWRQGLVSIGIAVVMLILSILPITMYNYTRFNRFVLLNTNAGYAFFWANHPIYGTRFRPASEMGMTYQELVPFELRQLDEAALDQELLKQGVQFVLDDPVRYIWLSLSRIPAYFKFWPDPASNLLSNVSRVTSFALFLPFMFYGLLRSFINLARSSKESLFVRPPFPAILLYLFILVYTAIHVLSWAQIRYRLPVDTILIVFAALAISDLGILITNWVERRNSDEWESGAALAMNEIKHEAVERPRH
jgi:4-amino-4-deoxy-L-arabinose transferase-like glycosyltransferase